MIIETDIIEHSMKTQNPFVATMYHLDHFPEGNGKLGPSSEKRLKEESAEDTNADWRMYYGKRVPGFPAHPHRGFETVTVVVQGTVDHTDGQGAQGRYEDGDVQWMTAGKGLQHAEMFPLRHTDTKNTLELFQIWLSLDRKHRMAEPAYKMLWREDIPVVSITDDSGLKTKITVIAGEVRGEMAPEPTPDSWAADKSHHLSIQIIELEPGATYNIPAGTVTLNRSIYFYSGEKLQIEDQQFTNRSYAFVTGENETYLNNDGSITAKVLMLEADPIPEPIVAYGPFVMSSMEEVKQAYQDYQETQFGGWPFSDTEVYHDANQERFARYADGSTEYPRMKETNR